MNFCCAVCGVEVDTEHPRGLNDVALYALGLRAIVHAGECTDALVEFFAPVGVGMLRLTDAAAVRAN